MRIWQAGSLSSVLYRASIGCFALGIILGFTCNAVYAEDVSTSHASEQSVPHERLEDVGKVVHEAVGNDATHEHIDYNKPPIFPKIPLFVFSFVLFLTFVLVMRPMVWTPLVESLDAREARVIKAEAEAKHTRVEVERLTAQAETRLAEVYNEVQSLIAKARSEAEAQRRDIVSKAEAEASRIKSDAIAAITNAKADAIRDLEATVDQQVALATTQVAGSKW